MSRGMTQPDLPAPAVQRRSKPAAAEPLLLKPLAQAIALLMLAGTAQAAQPFSSAWFAAKGASTAPASGSAGAAAQVPGTPPPLAQQQRLNQQFQRSLNNLNNTVSAIAAQQAAQAAGRTLAQVQPQVVPNGLGQGGLKVDENPLTQGWLNAKAPQQAEANGKTQVTIEQTADKAILNWETFNVGRDTTVKFAQQAEWAVLNRVNDPNARPSQIHGQIEAPGTVMLANRNGVVFSGTSQVNVRNLVAAAAQISDEQFTQRGLYVDTTGSQATFSQAAGSVLVERGAQIQTQEPASSTTGGGYVLLLGSEVSNEGQIISPKGQATLAAGDEFYIRRGQGTTANQYSTTRGNEVATGRASNSQAGTVRNAGLIQAAGGDITLTGHQVQQNGVALASTSVDRRGSIHLLNAASDSTGSVSFGQGSVTAIMLDESQALDSQRQASLEAVKQGQGNLATGHFDNLSTVADRTDQSRVEVVSGGTVHFQSGSLTLATGGQVAVSAGQRSLVDDGAHIDVAGALGVKVAMESNNIKINVQGNEQRDAAGNRDAGGLINSDVWVDVRELVHVAAGVNGYANERWYTAGGLLEVAGYLGTQNHSVGEWMAQGGTLTFTGQDLVTRAGAEINLSGGTLAVQDGVIQQSWLRGVDGRLYEVSKAPGDLLYTGVYRGYEDISERWGQTSVYYNPLIAPQQRFEQGYTVGRDAGSLVVTTQSAVLDGQLIGETWQDERQVQAPVQGLDGYQQTHSAQARGAQLVIGQQTPSYIVASKELAYGLAPVMQQVRLQSGAAGASASVDLDSALDETRRGRLVLDSEQLSAFGLGGLTVVASELVQVDGAVALADGGQLALHGPQVEVNADLVAKAGSISLGDVVADMNGGALVERALATPQGTRAHVSVADGVLLDASGVRSELNTATASAMRNGGDLSLRSSGDVVLGQSSLLDVSGGIVRGENNRLLGGNGGNLTLQVAANAREGGADATSQLQLDGQVRGYGSTGAGTLDIRGGQVQIGGEPQADAGVYLAADFFNLGFAQYTVRGGSGLTVAEGSQVQVTRPVQALNAGRAVSDQAAPWLPPLLLENAPAGELGQREGASLTLAAGDILQGQAEREAAVLAIGKGAAITVDPLQNIALRSTAQITLEGSLQALGGTVSLLQEKPSLAATGIAELPHERSIRLGSDASIDVSGQAYVALDSLGRRYGRVDAGGSIVIGGEIDHAKGTSEAMDLFLILEQGSQLRANGAQAALYVPGQGEVAVASAGGSISLASNNGLQLDGGFSAVSGGAGAAGGTLAVALDTGLYLNAYVADAFNVPRELLLTQHSEAQNQGMPAYGQGRLSVDQIQAAGFTSLDLLSDGVLAFDGDIELGMAQQMRLYAGSLVLSEGAGDEAHVHLQAPFVRLAGSNHLGSDVAKRPTVKGGLSQQASEGTLLVEANLLEVRDVLTLGAHGTLAHSDGQSLTFDRRGFGLASLVSAGDIRLLGLVGSGDRTRLISNADLTLQAAQIYPVTGAFASVETTQDATLRIASNGATPAAPLSVFGRLELLAGTVEQGGVLRAPLGQIAIGNASSPVQELRLLPGSITSVSAAGVQMPYGGTVDGLNYLYDGKSVSLLGAAGDASRGVSLTAAQVDVQAGALIDLSGGGELTGAGFISGRGGSTDARYNPLVQLDSDGQLVLPSLSSNPVYAIVPGLAVDYAPLAAEAGVSDPGIGQQITLDHGIPGLVAGTYTLLPASYALLPGAYRVELNGLAGTGKQSASLALRNGSWATSGRVSVVNTGIAQPVSSQVIVTAADTLRKYSQYNEMSYAAFVAADAATKGVPRAAIEADGKGLTFTFTAGVNAEDKLRFAGTVEFSAAKDGAAGYATVLGPNEGIELLADGTQSTLPGEDTASLYASQLSALHAPRLSIGARPIVNYGQGGNVVEFEGYNRNLWLRSGAQLSAGEVWMFNSTVSGGIFIEQGATVSTLGQGAVPFDASNGYLLSPGLRAMLAVSNGRMDIQPPTTGTSFDGAGSIIIGDCPTGDCQGQTRLYSEGSLFAVTNNTFSLGDQVRFGSRHLGLAVGRINVGSLQALNSAAQAGVLGAGLTLNQQVLDRLFQGNADEQVPALESLTLSASDSMSFFGTTVLDTFDPLTGQNRLQDLVLGTPAIYGAGGVDDRASIRTGSLVWKGAQTLAGTPITGGAGSGDGVLDIQVQDMTFGYGPNSQPNGSADMARQTLGFGLVNISASHQVTANHTGSLQVYHQRGTYQADGTFQYSGGDLQVSTPLWTGAAGSVNRIQAGGEVRVAAGEGALASGRDSLGAELALSGQRVVVDGTFSLPSGKLTLDAIDDVLLGDTARIDLAGRALAFNDVTRYSWGGDLVLASQAGSIRQAAASQIDLSASNNRAGRLTATALGEAGHIELLGQILGAASGYYDAGGTQVPYAAAEVNFRGQWLDDFTGLNQRLNRDQVFGARSFQIKQGDLVLGDELKASQISLSLDNGHLTVNGLVDASGERVGSIRLAAKQGLTVNGGARLDAHGSVLRVDSYGAIIDAPNRAVIELNSGEGLLTLASGAAFDLRHGTSAAAGSGPNLHDGRSLGTLQLIAPRVGGDTVGDIAIEARGALDITGARTIAVVGNQRYTDAPDGGLSASGRPFQYIDQAYLDGKDALNATFIENLLKNRDLRDTRLAGLTTAAYAQALHLRPGLEIATRDTQTDLIVQGDLDLSAHRYDSINLLTQKTSVYGSGEVGNLVLRAGGNLEIYGSINDGFAPPDSASDEARTDGRGWLLLPGKQPFDSDLVIPRSGVELAEGTLYPEGSQLNFDLPFADTTLPANTRLPTDLQLSASLTLPAGTVLDAAVRDTQGNLLYAAGTLLAESVTLPGGTYFDAGSRLPVAMAVLGGVWSKGVTLPAGGLSQRGPLELAVGARLPAGVDVKLAEDLDVIELRPSVDGQQGRNWALAQMLPQGSQSWSMRLVAGADLEAADSRLTRPEPDAGLLRLADQHYIADLLLEPGSGGTAPASGWVWSDINGAGNPPGDPVPEDQIFFCEIIPDWCTFIEPKKVLVWSDINGVGNPPGDRVPDEQIFFCEIIPEWCSEIDDPGQGGEPTRDRLIVTPKTQLFSVLRTGTGDLDLISAGDWRMDSLFGVYTAGTPSAALLVDGADPHQGLRGVQADGTLLGQAGAAYEAATAQAYQAWYPEQGGNLYVEAGSDLLGNLMASKLSASGVRPQQATASVGNWLWRQGQSDADTPAAWWINFGTYAQQPSTSATDPWLVGFTGIGTLGGGNLDVRVTGAAGLQQASNALNSDVERSQGLDLVVASSGRIDADGRLVQTGGGDLNLRVGGGINPGYAAAGSARADIDLQGTLVNVRGALQVDAQSVGVLEQLYGSYSVAHDNNESRAYDPYTSSRANAMGGLALMVGDSGVRLQARGDMVVQGVGDPGRVSTFNTSPYLGDDGITYPSEGYSWFSLWRPTTSVSLMSSGGNLVPVVTVDGASPSTNLPVYDGRIFYPTALSAVAANGSLYYGSSAVGTRIGASSPNSLMVAPSFNTALELLAGDSIYASGYVVSQAGTDSSAIATPQRPAFAGIGERGAILSGNLHADLQGEPNDFPLYTYDVNTYSQGVAPLAPVRFYALDGDIVGLATGEILTYELSGRTLYQGSGPVRIMAGRDIVNAGVPLQTSRTTNSVLSTSWGPVTSTGNLIIHGDGNDVSLVSAGRDIRLSTFNVAGPGQLEVVAGRDLYQSGQGIGSAYQEASINSIGRIDGSGSGNDGASIAVLVGAGAQGADYRNLLERYLNPSNLLDTGASLASQPDKVAKVYDQELVTWLGERFAFQGDSEAARAYFATLPAEQQRIFARQMYFAELREGGREYTDVDGPRTGSYLRGRQAIAALFPEKDVAGNPISYSGNATFYGGAGIHTDFGGDIQVLTPGGQQVFGIEGEAPPSTAGVITQGSGDIQLYAQGSILLGQSRIMTTFGGSILGWSAEGDINAGRGSKTTVVYTPPKRTYDLWGNVALAPSVPSTGAGIATLNPIAEVAPGDIDLIAPLGTIDAGEAGIRVSGNVNIAALQVVNAANIQVQGDAKGMPVVASVNTGAIASASAAASSATQAAEEVGRQQQAAARQRQPSVITVRVLGFGGERLVPGQDGASLNPQYNRQSPVQVLGAGQLDERARGELTEEERGNLLL
ncbi:filamentous hemagglutinin N-terminal domain-containing protein [Pantoea sp. Ap-967]|uniref:filamentous hemagglutinin family protein n=1 Tax=Pantoea sp. Ap-967 TaxID=2608362 RepID=UPI00142101BF|nr:filamentous hemagglutinin family protein [Pantoea sp. Ap-967]NIE73425.1 filamentous hemagglutinin N-terminal domain-containing protein [Pantoea sp. Ap-967]